MKKYTLLIIIILGILLFKNLLDLESYIFSALELDRTITRQEYLGEGLGKIYKNRYGVKFFNNIYPRLIKFESNYFSDLSTNYIYIIVYGMLLYAGIKKFK